jgi:uncharacterized protein DUF4136
MTRHVAEGTLTLTFVDRTANKVIWTGTISQDLDIKMKKKSLQLVEKSIIKLLKQFPTKQNSCQDTVIICSSPAETWLIGSH